MSSEKSASSTPSTKKPAITALLLLLLAAFGGGVGYALSFTTMPMFDNRVSYVLAGAVLFLVGPAIWLLMKAASGTNRKQ